MIKLARRYITGLAVLCGWLLAAGCGQANQVVAGSIQGSVTGDVMEGVAVDLIGSVTQVATTDVRGTYGFRDLPDGTYTVTPRMAGFRFVPGSQQVAVADGNVVMAPFTSSAMRYTISGSVTGAVTTDVTVRLSGPTGWTELTRAGGAFEFREVPAGVYTVTPLRDGYTFDPPSATVTVSGGDRSVPAFAASAVAARTYRVGGMVTGEVLAGVTMTLGGAKLAPVVTSAEGAFEFLGVTNGTFTVTPAHAGYTFQPASVQVTVNGADVTGPIFAATRITHAIRGSVRGASSGNVYMVVTGPTSRTVSTDASGGYVVTGLASGTYTVTPALAGFTFSPTSATVVVNGADVTLQDFQATPVTYSVRGAVAGDATVGVSMTMTPTGTGSGLQVVTVPTDAAGIYRFTGVAAGTYTVTPTLGGYSFSPSSLAVTVSDLDVVAPSFTATRVSYSLSGVVTGAASVGVPVTLTAAGTGAEVARGLTDGTGTYRFGGLASGTYIVTPRLAGFAFSPPSATVLVSESGPPGPAFQATRIANAISGTVRGAGAGMVLLTVSGATTQTTTTDPLGNYRVPDLVNGTYRVTPTLAGYSFSPPSFTVVVNGADLTLQDFTATAVSYAVSGAVSGAAIAGVTMTLTGTNAPPVTTDGTGTYHFPNLGNGTYTVMPTLAGYSFSPSSALVTVNGADVGAVNFTAALDAFAISGTVSGDVLAGVTMTLAGASVAPVTTDATGAYRFGDLRNGNYTVTPSMTGVTFSPVSATVTVSGAGVTVPAFQATRITHAISGTVAGAGTDLVYVTVSGTPGTTVTTDLAGNYRVTGLSSGTYTVTPTLAGYTFSPASKTVVVSGADVPLQDFTATPVTCSISGAVSGAVATGVTMTLTGTTMGPVLTDSAGAYLFTGLASGTYTVTPTLSGYTFSPSSAMVVVSGASVTGQNFTSALATYAVSGVVSGDVSAGVTMTLTGAVQPPTTTDPMGSYRFGDLPNGTYTVTPAMAGYTFSPATARVTVNGAAATIQEFKATRITYAIGGAVKGAGNATVRLAVNGTTSQTVTTDTAGVYRATGLSNGTYTVTPTLVGYTFSPSSATAAVNGADVALPDFTATPVSYAVSGVVSGVVAQGVTVRLTQAGATVAESTTDATGRYGFSGLATGTYAVTPTLKGYQFEPAFASVGVNGAQVAGQDFVSMAAHGPACSPDRWCWALPVPNLETVIDIWSVSPSEAWMVGYNGAILRYAGGVWSSHHSSGLEDFSGVWGESGSSVWIVGRGGVIKHWNGFSMQYVSSGTLENLNDIWGSARTDVWAVGNAGALLHWDGTMWTPAVSDTVQNLTSIWGFATDDVWAVGSNGTILRWNGSSWLPVPNVWNEPFTGVWGSSPTDVWIVGAWGSILHWDGNALAPVDPGIPHVGLNAVWGSSGGGVWILDRGWPATLLHWDGGAWTATIAPVDVDMNTMAGSSPTNAWAGGYRGAIIHWDGTSWTPITSGSMPNLEAVWGTSVTDIWAVGGVDGLLHWDGHAWQPTPAGITAALHGISGSSESDVWVVGDQGTILQWTGTAWTVVSSGPTDVYRDVRAFSSRDVWVVGDGGLIRHWDGTAWTTIRTVTGANLTGIWGAGSQDVWMVSGAGELWHWNGSALSLAASDPTASFSAVGGTSASDLWMVGGGSEVWHWDGTAMRRWASTNTRLNDVWAASASDVWFVGSSGAILHWDGSQLRSMESGTYRGLMGLWGLPGVGVWAVGTRGAILQYVP